MTFGPLDDYAMRLALDQALNAQLAGEVPVGAVILRDGQLLATGYNRPVTTHDPSAHAEIVALRHAAQLVENYRLPDCELYVTLEPCAMCAMALMHARFKRVVFATPDPKTGAAGSVVNLFDQPLLNHHTQVVGGLMAEPAAALLRQFFAERRAQQRAERDRLREAADRDKDRAAAAASASVGGGAGAMPSAPLARAPSIPTGDAVELPFDGPEAADGFGGLGKPSQPLR